jgi:hypothetical protein
LSGKVLTGGRLNAFNALDAITCPNLPARILATGSEYPTLQTAYNAAVEGDTIQSQAVFFNGDLYINQNKSVTLEGGYDCDYTTAPGDSTLIGTIFISDGTVTIQNFILE